MFAFFREKLSVGKYSHQELPLTNINQISRKRILYTDSEGREAIIFCKDAHRGWCRHKKIRISALKYVCDRTKAEGRKLIFYTDPQILFYAETVDEQRWIDVLNRLALCGCPAFDLD